MVRFSLDPSKAQQIESKIYADQNILRHLYIKVSKFTETPTTMLKDSD